jgi:lipopolysaccharide/colanic/teichoic acid biosynthesis glycosyltransferase
MRTQPSVNVKQEVGNADCSFYRERGKRAMDFSLAFACLILLGAPMLLIGWIILLVDGSPALFKQQRVGQGGRLFTIVKFRTMCNRTQAGSSITVASDARVSRLGKLLRRLKLDEFPQLINVLKGDMSFVGPRPDVPEYVDQLQGKSRVILLLRPGITGPATLAFRNEEQLLAKAVDPKKYNDEVVFPEKVRLNIEYFKAITLKNDLELILKTVFS